MTEFITLLLIMILPYQDTDQKKSTYHLVIDGMISVCSRCQNTDPHNTVLPEASSYTDLFHNSHVYLTNTQWDSLLITSTAALDHSDNPQNEWEQELLEIALGRACYKLNLLNESLDHYVKAYHHQGAGHTDLFTQLHLIIGTLLISQEKYSEALSYFSDMNTDELDNASLKKLRHNMGISYLHLKDYPKAEECFTQSLEIKKELRDTLGLATEYMDIANLYYNQYLDDKAIPLFEKGLEYAKLAKDQKVLQNAYLNMAVVEENRNAFKKALEYRKEYEKIVKELWDRDKVWELAEQEKHYEVSLKEKEIAVLEEQDKTRQAEFKSQRLQRNYSLGAAILLLCVALGMVIGYRKVQQSNQLISSQRNELATLNQAKNRLFSIIAHDLKTPVNALQKANKKLSLAIDKGDDENIRSIARENEKITESTYGLLNNLLQWALDQSDQILIKPELLAASRIIDQVIYDYQGPLLEKSIVLHKNIPSDQTLFADLNSIRVILRNLLDNAIKFTPHNGQISITSEDKNGLLYLSIRDNGSGMDPDLLGKLFTMDSTRVNPDTEGRRSTGLGLNLCISLAHKNNGDINAMSEKGQGSTFTVILPAKNLQNV